MSKYDFSSITTLQEANAYLGKLICQADNNIREAEALADKFGLEFNLPTGGSGVYDGYRGEGEGEYDRSGQREAAKNARRLELFLEQNPELTTTDFDVDECYSFDDEIEDEFEDYDEDWRGSSDQYGYWQGSQC